MIDTATNTRHVLVVVDDSCTAPALCASLRSLDPGESLDVLVVSPERGAADAQWYVDEDAVRAEAVHRLRTFLGCLSREGIHASGRLGDADPVHAVADALHTFAADEIVFVTAHDHPSTWLRPNAVERIRRTFTQPVRRLEMPSKEVLP